MIGFVLLLLACAFLNAGEMAIISSDWVKFRYWTEKKVRGAKFAFNLLHSQDRLILVTMVGTNLTIVTMSVIANKFWYNILPSALVSLITTIVIFVFAEILPKVIVLRWKNKFFLVFARFFVFLYWLFSPFIFLTHWISLGFLRILDAPRITHLPKFTKDEIRIASRRALPIIEQSFVARLFEFKHKVAKDIMVPKNLICAAPITSDISELKTLISQSGFSRIPIYDTTLDNIVGYVFVRDLLYGRPGGSPVQDIIKPCKTILETTPISTLLDELSPVGSRPGGTVVIVKDVHNKTTGILTMEDVIEELFGEIEDEYDIS